MRIGILTFHSEINYGSVLQAYAMQTALSSLGYEVVIIDKWEDPDNRRLLGPFSSRSIGEWCGVLLRGLFLTGEFARLRRRLKTKRLIDKYLKRTGYHFFEWGAAPKDLGVDVIVVGSDQVWNPDIVDPPDYLLRDVPKKIVGIAYAASIGQHELEPGWLQEYKSGFRRFNAIGVREKEAKALVESTGSPAVHVVDPTLLVPSKVWQKNFCSRRKSSRRLLFCYLMTQSIEDAVPHLNKFALANDADVELFVDNQILSMPIRSVSRAGRWLRTLLLLANARVRVKFDASPDEFVNSVANSTWSITESFHGLMFATIFRKNVRVVVRARNSCREKMSARLTEFSRDVLSGNVIHSTLEAALSSLSVDPVAHYDEQKLQRRIESSGEWLKDALGKVQSHEK